MGSLSSMGVTQVYNQVVNNIHNLVFLNMDFSLFKTITQRVSVLNNNPPAMRVETICYTKKSPIRYNIVVQATIVRKDGDFNG